MVSPLLFIVLLFVGYACNKPQELTTSISNKEVKSDTTAVATIDFKKDIQPILVAHCSPCHFPGGKLYARLPFDNPQTILGHPDGIFRRIKDEGEVKKLKAFIASAKRVAGE